MKKSYTIADLSKEFDITPRTLRFYEAKGILAPERIANRRRYAERDRTRLKLTLRGKRLGMSLEECKKIIDMYDPKTPGSSDQLLYLIRKICEHRSVLLARINDLETTLKEMDEVEQKCITQLLNSTALAS